MAIDPRAICDAIAADLTTTGGLTPATTKKYQEPRVFDVATDLPSLAVWTEATDYNQIDTAGTFARTHHFTAAWFVFDDSVNNHGYDVTATVAALDTTREQIVARLAAYSQGIPGYGNQLCATLRRSELVELETAGMWRIAVDVDVDDWA